MLALSRNINTVTTPAIVALVFWPLNLAPLPCAWSLTTQRSSKRPRTTHGSILNLENTLDRIAKSRFKTKMDKRSGFWQVDLTRAAQELLAFVTLKGRVFRCLPLSVSRMPLHSLRS